MVSISDINDPFERYIAFLIERDKIYYRKTTGRHWPWTEDSILQEFSFTEVYRERDRTSLHYQKTIRDYYTQDDAFVLPGTVLYRWFNRMSTCDSFFGQPDFGNKSIFEHYIDNPGDKDLRILLECLEKIPTPHVTGAFTINGKPGHEKGVGVLCYFHEWCKKPWEDKWKAWLDSPPLLEDMYDWLRVDSTGLGPFMAAQLVADLKYLPFMVDVMDWWTWAAPGPGSQRGLNIICDRSIGESWKPAEWLKRLQELNAAENKELVPLGLGPFHAQDTQNHLCEFSKYEKTRLGTGRPRQRYHGAQYA
jgi:hypothetical protein